MAGAWTPSHWLHWNSPWSRTLTLAPGTFITREVRLERPVEDAGVQNTWLADHLGLKQHGSEQKVGVTFHVPRSSAASLSAADAEQLLEQSRALSQLRRAEPHFVHVFEQGTAKGGIPFIVTEQIEGPSARQRLVSGPLSLEEVACLVTQVAGALARAHAAGVAHGKLCPEALFLARLAGQPFVKVLGFGATFPDPREPDGPSASYSSPEQLLLGTGADAQSDLWALAVTVYELLTTILPFEAPTPAGVAVAICNAQFSPPSHYRADLPAGIDAWFARALAKSRPDRFADAIELARAFALAARPAHTSPAAGEAPEARPIKFGDELGDEDEMTVRWDLPADWGSGPAAAEAPSRPLPGEPPPLPQRAPSPRPPAALESPAATGFSAQPPTTAAFPQTSYLAAVASALAVPSTAAPGPASSGPASSGPASSPPRRARPPSASRPSFGDWRWIAAAATFGAVALGAAWLSSRSDPELKADAPLASSPASESSSVVMTIRAEDLPEVGSADNDGAASPAGDLPAIIRTHDLPPAPGEAFEGAPSPVAKGAGVSRGSPAPANLAPPVTRRAAAAPSGCNPPYYFDANKIRRLKLECLGDAPAAPAQRKHALSPAPPSGKPLAGNPPNGGASCTPPYFFDSNNIRRLKLECL